MDDNSLDTDYKGAWWDYHYAVVFWLIVAAILFSPFAFADTLTYQSQTLSGTSSEQDGAVVISNPQNDVYTIDVTISGPLAPNLNNQMITPTGWVVTCAFCLDIFLSSSNTDITQGVFASAAVFMFSTDSTGKITNWNFCISGNFVLPANDGGNNDFLSKTTGVFTSSLSNGDNASSSRSDTHQDTQTNSGPAGNWSQSSLSNPAPPPTAAVTPAVKVQPQVRLWFFRF